MSIGGAWILFSDAVIAWMVKDPAGITQLQTYKGSLFIVVTSVILLALIRGYGAEYSRTEEALRESEIRLRGIASAALDAVILINKDGNVSFWNNAATRIFGYSSEEVEGRDLHSFIMPERHIDTYRKGFAAFQSTGEGRFVGDVYEIEAKRKDGTEFPVELSLSALKLNGEWSAVGIVRDITDRKRAEGELRRSYELTNTILNSMNDAISLIDVRDFRIMAVNNVFLNKYGYPDESGVTDKHCYEITHRRTDVCSPPDDVCPLKETVKTGEHFSVEHVHYGKQGEKIYVEVSTSPIKDEDGNVVQVVHVQRNITERKHTEQRLTALMEDLRKSNEDLDQFTAVLAHDLKNPLITITNFARLLHKKYAGAIDEKGTDFLRIIKESSERMIALIEELRDFAKIGAVSKEYETLNMEKVIRKAIENMDSEIKKSSVDIRISAMPAVRGKEVLIIQLIQNLLGNSIKFRREDVQLSISVSAELRDGLWVFRFKDNGRGIETSDIRNIFIAFRRGATQEEGLGLGLAICKKIVEWHGGSIRGNSKPGKGTTIYFSIPSA